MNSSPSKPKAPLSRIQSLACIPKQNEEIQWQQLDNGEILFTYAVPLGRLFLSLHRRFSKNEAAVPTKKLQLDQMGSFVWKEIDGKKTVKEIIGIFAHSHKVTSHEAETAVAPFLRSLGQRGFIGLYGPF